MVYLRTIFKQLPHFLTPGICFLCRERTHDHSLICNGCKNDLPYNRISCIKCGKAQLAHTICNSCNKQPPEIDRTITSFSYQFPVTELIKKLKYNQKVIIAQELGSCLATSITEVSTSLPDCILPVPLHRFRYISRGFNQATEIAIIVAKKLSLSIDTQLLDRTRNTLAQFDLNPFERKQNVKNAFILNTKPEYKSVAIIDDVITTGSTVNEIAKVLKTAGVKRVEAWTCARAVQP